MLETYSSCQVTDDLEMLKLFPILKASRFTVSQTYCFQLMKNEDKQVYY